MSLLNVQEIRKIVKTLNLPPIALLEGNRAIKQVSYRVEDDKKIN